MQQDDDPENWLPPATDWRGAYAPLDPPPRSFHYADCRQTLSAIEEQARKWAATERDTPEARCGRVLLSLLRGAV